MAEVTPRPKNGRRQRRQTRKTDAAYRKVSKNVESRAGGSCEARIEGVCLGRGDAAHHVILRSQGGPDEEWNLLWVCNDGCHAFIHANRAWARENGFIRRAAS
jgi:hypothetical protein